MEENVEKKEKKNRKFLKVVGIIILILLLILLIYFIRNYVIVSSLIEAKDITNYSYTLVTNNGFSLDSYYKDSRYLSIIKTNGTPIGIEWYDDNTKESISINFENSTATVSNSGPAGFYNFAKSLSDQMLSNKVRRTFNTFITTEEVDGVECYRLQPIMGAIGSAYYYSKENKLLTSIQSIGEIKSFVNFINWEINTVTDEDVARPDLSNYEIIENE